MPLHPRRLASRLLVSVPVYRLLPPGSLRSYAGLRYHRENSTSDELAAFVDRSGSPRSRNLAMSIATGRAAFLAGQDDMVERVVAEASDRFPESPDPLLLGSDLHGFRGEYAVAQGLAADARWLEPSDPRAMVQLVRLAHVQGGPEASAPLALCAVERFPTSGAVLWAAAKACTDGAQFERLLAVWRERATGPRAIERAVRQLATAAARAGRIEDAIALYEQAMESMVAWEEPLTQPTPTRLRGRGAWQAIEDLTSALDEAGVPFFFAAGTALGLVREGRPLALDGDIDVGVLDRDFDRETLEALFRDHPRFEFDLAHPGSKKIALRHRGGSPVDIFRFYEADGRWWHDAVFVRWHNTPFEVARTTIQGIDVPLPTDADPYLTENYGGDWRTPRPDFDAFTDDAPNVDLTWPDYLRLHHVRRAYRCLGAGDLPAARRELARADLGEMGASLARVRSGETRAVASASPVTPAKPGAPLVRPEEAVAASREAERQGRHDAAVGVVESAIRTGGWSHAKLWTERLSLMQEPEDLEAVSALWLASPRGCRANSTILRSVARSAAIAGDQERARALLRSAIVLRARDRQRPRARLGRAKQRFLERSLAATRPAEGPADFSSRAAVALRDLDEILSADGVRAFLISGTLLGLVREGTVISWDKDIDVGVFSLEVATVDLERSFVQAPTFQVRRVDLTSTRLRVQHDNGVAIDIFPHYPDPDGGLMWHDGAATRWWNQAFDVQRADFLDVSTWIPDPPERYLEENYGDWRTPDPDFDARLDAPNVEVIDDDYMTTLLFFGVLDAIGKDDARKRERFVSLLRGRGEGAWLNRL